MQKVKIQSYEDNDKIISRKCPLFEFSFEFDNSRFKTIAYAFILLSFLVVIILDQFYVNNRVDLKPFKKYVNDCKNLVRYDRNKIFNQNPYVAVCLSALNMENYIEKNILSIINQKFQDFEIIVINDKSTDETENIIKQLQLEDDRIKLISHTQNLGVYRSRIESILNSKSKFILLMDPDDMYLNENLLQELFDYNLKYNLDIIEFSVYQQYENKNKIYFPNNDYETHFHKFSKSIIYQPELSQILYYIPGTKDYSHTICRNIWNKMIRRNIFIQTYHYIGKEYFNDFIITADDMIMNIITYQFSNNYTNINLPGYLYIIRKVSMSRGDGGEKLMKIRALNHLSYFKLFYKYLQDFNKDRNFLFFEMKDLNHYILYLKQNNMNYYLTVQINFVKQLLKDNNISVDFKNYLNNLLIFFMN